MTFLRLLVVVALFHGGASAAHACTCIPVGPSEDFERSDAVFEATVESTEPGDGHVDVSLTLHRSWKGVTVAETRLRTPDDGAACGFFFEKGKTYLIYAWAITAAEEGDPTLSTSICNRTIDVTLPPFINEDLPFLNTVGQILPGDASTFSTVKALYD